MPILPTTPLRGLATLVLAVLLAPRASAAPEPAPLSIDAAAFLTGCWASEGNGATVEELWLPPAGGAMVGVSRTVKGDRMTLFEFLRIDRHEGRLSYIAQPRGGDPVAFALTEATSDRLRFENPQHDFPQRIVYRKVEGGGLRAELAGPATDREAPFAIDYRRVDCPAGK